MTSTTSRYQQIADAAGVTLCRERECAGQEEPMVVHFPNIRFTKPGAFHLMRACYRATTLEHPGWSSWEHLWDRVRFMTFLASRIHMRIPKYLWAIDKAKMREEIAKARRKGDEVTKAMRQAEDWARR